MYVCMYMWVYNHITWIHHFLEWNSFIIFSSFLVTARLRYCNLSNNIYIILMYYNCYIIYKILIIYIYKIIYILIKIFM